VVSICNSWIARSLRLSFEGSRSSINKGDDIFEIIPRSGPFLHVNIVIISAGGAKMKILCGKGNIASGQSKMANKNK
jgi:hypothetical protein